MQSTKCKDDRPKTTDHLHEVFEIESTQETETTKDTRVMNKMKLTYIIKCSNNLKPQLPRVAKRIPSSKLCLKSLPTKNLSSNTHHQYKCSTRTKTARSNIEKLATLRNSNLVINAKIGKLENHRNLLLGKAKDTWIKYFADRLGRETQGIHNMK